MNPNAKFSKIDDNYWVVVHHNPIGNEWFCVAVFENDIASSFEVDNIDSFKSWEDAEYKNVDGDEEVHLQDGTILSIP